MKCDNLQAETIVPQGTAITLQMYPKAETDVAIAELKAENESLKVWNERLMYWPHTDNSAVIANLREENERLKAELQKQKDAYCELDAMYQRNTGIACKALGKDSVICQELRDTRRALYKAMKAFLHNVNSQNVKDDVLKEIEGDAIDGNKT